MSVKQVVFEYLEKHPKQSLDQVVDGLPEYKKASVKKYYYDFRKLKMVVKKEKKATAKSKQNKQTGGKSPEKEVLSIRQRIYDLLTKTPGMTIDALCQEIEGSNRKTVRDYRNRWRKENRLTKSATPSKSLPKNKKKYTEEKNAVHDFMNQYPEANLNDLRKLFPKNEKLVTDFRSWKQLQPKKVVPARKKGSESSKSNLPAKSNKKNIQSLKQIIEKQKLTIEAQRSKLKEVRSQLVRTSKFSLDGLKSFLVDKILKR